MTHTRITPTGLVPEDAIAVILAQPPEVEYSAQLEKKVLECIKDALADKHPTVRVVPSDEFRRVAFRDLTPEQILSGDSYWEWNQLAKDPAFATRTAPPDLRYLIIVSGGTTTDTRFDVEGGGQVMAWEIIWHKESDLRARIIDLKQGREAGIVRASASGETVWLWPPAPLVIPTFPEGRACSELGEGVAKVLAGEMEAEQPEETLPTVIEETLPTVTEETFPAVGEELGTSTDKAEEDDCWPPCLCADQSC
jgi:hypothetical protein